MGLAIILMVFSMGMLGSIPFLVKRYSKPDRRTQAYLNYMEHISNAKYLSVSEKIELLNKASKSYKNN